jgi:galactose mutarotase-like enzyme
MFTIENEHLKIVIKAKGAEWNGDPLFWGKKSPVLFPIVGTLKNDKFYFLQKAYQLSRHGFARDREFTVTEQTSSAITFTLESNEATLEHFPFQFRFDIIYNIHENKLDVLYKVTNTGIAPMYFSVGGHPAFKIPLSTGNEYNDYYLEFNEFENSGRWPISKEGLIEMNPVPFLNNSKQVPLTKELFYKDALVFKNLRSTKVKLLSDKSSHGFEFDFTGFPFLGIWAAKNADFVCIEPWCGIADTVNTSQQLPEKEGINYLEPKKNFMRHWSVTIF